MTRLAFVLLLAVLTPTVQASPPVAALRQALRLASTDSARGRLNVALSESTERNDSCVYYAQQAIGYLEAALAGARGDERKRVLALLGVAVNNVGVGFDERRGEQQRAEKYYARAARLRQQGGDARGAVESFYNLGIARRDQGNYAGALRAFQQGVRAGQQAPAAQAKVAQCLIALGGLDAQFGEVAAQRRRLRLAALRLEQPGPAVDVANAYSRLAAAYLYEQHDTARAEACARRAQRVGTGAPGAERFVAEAWRVSGSIRLGQHREAQARAYLLHALQLSGQNQLTRDVADTHLRLAQTEAAAGRPRQALRYARLGAAEAAQTGVVRLRRDAEQLLAQVYDALGQPRAALSHYRRFVALRDSVRSEETSKLLFGQRLRAEFAQEAARLRAAQAQRQAAAVAEIRHQRHLRWATLAGAGGLLLLAAGLYYAFRRSERLTRLVTAQKRGLQAQRDQLDASLTELRATQAQLIQKEKMASLGELTAGIAHEIQNPLNFVNNFAEVSAELCREGQELLGAAGLAAAKAELCDLLRDVGQNQAKILQHGQRAAGIVTGMLAHSHSSAGERRPTDLNALCDECLRLAYRAQCAKDSRFAADLATDFEAGLPAVTVASADVGRVLLNLFTNAFYAVRQRQQTGEPGYQPRVGVRTAVRDGHVHLVVTDNGAGIPSAVLPKVFLPFFTTKPTGEGTGLGLSLSYDIVAQGHGGALTVESQEGQGATFCVRLPVDRPVAGGTTKLSAGTDAGSGE